jgi:hypothetical protein
MPAFDPSKYIIKLKGKDYLEVKWRLVWFRETHPDGAIDTENIALTDQLAVFKATVQIPSGGRATGYGSESPKDFGDYIEKAETKALGRALGALGFGTQFTDDFDEGTDNPVDAPRQPRQAPPPMPVRSPQTATNTAPRSLYPPPGHGPTDSQRNFMNGLAKQLGWTVVAPDGSDHHDAAQMDGEVSMLYPGKKVDDLTVTEASAVIEQWKKVQADRRKHAGIE